MPPRLACSARAPQGWPFQHVTRLGAGPCKGAAVLVTVGLLLTGCASGPDSDGDTVFPPMDAIGSPAEAYLQVIVDRGDGTEPETYTLVCDGRADDAHPAPEAACAHLEGLDEPFAPLDEDLACTEIYGGPQTAHVQGRWDGVDVDVDLRRTDGCFIAQWDSLGPLLPGPVG